MTNDPKSDDQLIAELKEAGCDATEILVHRDRILRAVQAKEKPEFKIIDTCRLANGGLLPQEIARKLAAAAPFEAVPAGRGVAAFVPAAGAASRYSQPLAALVELLEASLAPGQSANSAALVQAVESLASAGATSWPLPARVMDLLVHPNRAVDLSESERKALIENLSLPKALMPCVKEGLTFLAVKTRENAAIPGLEGEAYVAPRGASDGFKTALAGLVRTPTAVFEQGAALSTLRFLPDGEPYREKNGKLSLVPAGHGALAELFPGVLKAFPRTKTLFIRNIDNVMGLMPEATAATETFLSLHRQMLAAITLVREALAGSDWTAAQAAARPLFSITPELLAADGDKEKFLASVASQAQRELWRLQFELFHSPLPRQNDATALRALYARPLNLLGQVPNTGGDVGGTPCFVSTPHGAMKVVIEVPHASAADKADFLANPARATHFNPVFAAVEVTDDPHQYRKMNRDFWLLADKNYRGTPVLYHETVMYELIGNSSLANAIFIEVPRAIFNPHKALKDAVNRTAKDWRL